MSKKTLISWSSGKDSAWTLHVLRQDPNVEVVGLFCTVNKMFDRVAIHGVRVELLKQQAESVNLPLHIVYLPFPCTDDDYIQVMNSFIIEAENMGIECFAFGDLFLEDVRQYRERLLKGTGITPIFPIWGIPTITLSKQMIADGLKAVITCLNPKDLAIEFAGNEYNEKFLNEIPKNIDPCGEYGEFHSFAFDGPMFKNPIDIILGETVLRGGFCFKDLLPSTFENTIQELL